MFGLMNLWFTCGVCLCGLLMVVWFDVGIGCFMLWFLGLF